MSDLPSVLMVERGTNPTTCPLSQQKLNTKNARMPNFFTSYSAEEAARYIETYKIYENKPPEALQGQTSTDYLSKVCSCKTSSYLIFLLPPLTQTFSLTTSKVCQCKPSYTTILLIKFINNYKTQKYMFFLTLIF